MNPALIPPSPRAMRLLGAVLVLTATAVPAQSDRRVPDGVRAHRDLRYVENGHEKQKLDLYLPDKVETPLPLIIWVHGGGWQAGSKEQCPLLRRDYFERGYAVASIGYRLSGDAVFPAQIEDCKAAIRWLRAHAKEYHLDPQRFGVWGSSAGGHLVALLGTSGGVKEFDVGAQADQSSRVQAVCDWFGPTDLVRFVGTPGYESHAAAGSPESKLIGGVVLENRDKAARANPITYVTKDDPPFLIMHGDKDPTVPINQSEALFEALKKTGVSVHFHTIHGAGHGGPGFVGSEIDERVGRFFDEHLKGSHPAGAPPEARVTESNAAVASPERPAPPSRPTAGGARRGIPWEAVLAKDDKNKDGKVSREEFSGPPALFDRIDGDRDGFITLEEHKRLFQPPPAPPPQGQPAPGSRPPPPSARNDAPGAATPSAGLLYFASYPERDNPAPASNPHLAGALFTIYWSDIETSEGVFDWVALDRRAAVWRDAGKKFALRIMWSSSGNWPEPAAKHPTPRFVLDAGAVAVHSDSSKTDIPLVWDPVYRKHAARFLGEVARKFDGDPDLLFVDVTPGAETNPYRFRRINVNEPEFKERFAGTPASDGRKYTHELWLATVREAVDDAATAFQKTPLLITLNVGSLDGPEQFQAMGEHCVSRGCYVGQNGLNSRSYDSGSPRQKAFLDWGAKTRLYFEMVDASGGGTGSLMDVMKAAERIGCHYLGVYAADVLRGTRGQPNFDPEYESALAYGAKVVGRRPGRASSAAPAPGGMAQNFKLEGENWTYRDGDFEMNGILLKPKGEGPFPAALISHGLGGSAESFGMQKAREMVAWGLVCIAPNYTHAAKRGAPRMGAPPRDAGASEENIRRARTCVEILGTLGYVDGKRIGAYGHSMGGFVTIGLAAAAPDLLKAAAISGSGIAPRAGFAAPGPDAAAKIRIPFLILHGGADTTVRPEQSASFKEILDRNRVPNERLVFEGENHPVDQTRRQEVFARIREWWVKQGVLKS